MGGGSGSSCGSRGRECQEGDGFDSQEAGEGEGIGVAQDWSVGTGRPSLPGLRQRTMHGEQSG